jgi:succinyl-diaminopimelate desuccinylase
VHHGDSAIDKLMEAMSRIGALRGLRAQGQAAIADIVRKASSVSERYSGAGESDVLLDLTVTFGTVSGGRLPNLIADHAEATADIRLPMGISADDILAAVEKCTADIPGVSVEVLKAYEPTWSDPDHALVHALAAAATDVLGTAPVVNMRVGASDARLYRYAGIPTIVCGLTPHNMGAADEFVDAEELMSLGEIFVQAAFSFLNGEAGHGRSGAFPAAV